MHIYDNLTIEYNNEVSQNNTYTVTNRGIEKMKYGDDVNDERC